MQGVKLEVLAASNIKDYSKWLKIWTSWPKQDIFAHPDYMRLYETNYEKAHLFVYETNKGVILYPFIKRYLSALDWAPKTLSSWVDLSSPYGYGGAYYWGDSDTRREISDKFWKACDEWMKQENCVSEFIRFNLFEKDLAVYHGERILRYKNIVRDLELSEDSLWMDFEHKVRKNINKSRRLGLECIIDKKGQYLEDFLKIYESTMARREADDSYYFSRKYFEDITKNLPDNSVYFHILDNNKIVSTELVLYSSYLAYSFLGGTIEEAFDKRPNDLLKYQIMVWAKEHGISNYVLGGGYAAEDGIYYYKRSFAPNGEYNFYTGQRIINECKYHELVNAKKVSSKTTWCPRDGYFPQYRS